MSSILANRILVALHVAVLLLSLGVIAVLLGDSILVLANRLPMGVGAIRLSVWVLPLLSIVVATVPSVLRRLPRPSAADASGMPGFGWFLAGAAVLNLNTAVCIYTLLLLADPDDIYFSDDDMAPVVQAVFIIGWLWVFTLPVISWAATSRLWWLRKNRPLPA